MSTAYAQQLQLELLDWDCRNFGFPVARVDYRVQHDAALVAALDEARHRRIDMVVVATPADLLLPATILGDFGGELVDRKATFERALAIPKKHSSENRSVDERIRSYDEPIASTELVQLSIAAGVYSRYSVDRRFPPAKYRDLYRIWIERSVRREIADGVLVERSPNEPACVRGFVTVSCADGVGKIGLIAVAEEHRGRGVGRRLLDAAHDWMRRRGAHHAQVVTQLANAPACALYGSCGYELSSVQNIYHFWPLIGAGRL